MGEPSSLFLSYASADREFATRLAMDLKARGVRVWIDQEEMSLGDLVVDRLRQAIGKMDYFAVILSPAALASEWVKKEIEIALWQETDAEKSRVLPLLYQGCELPWFLKDRVYADFTKPDSYQDCVNRLLQKLGFESAPVFLVYDLGGGTLDVSLIKLKDEYRTKVDTERLFSDLSALGVKHQQEIENRDAKGTDEVQHPAPGDAGKPGA